MGLDSRYGQVIRLPQRRREATRRVPLPAPRVGTQTLQEALCDHAVDASAIAMVLACLAEVRDPLLWVSDRMSRRESGRLHMPGLRSLKVTAPILHVEVSHPRDVLWAMEEGATCGGLSAVVGEIHGAPSVLDFTATKRLALRAEASGVPVWLIRGGDPGGLSAARERWRISSLPSASHRHDTSAPGAAIWKADLFRARSRPPGIWEVHYDPDAPDPADRLRLVSGTGDGEVACDHPAKPDRAGG